MGRLAYYLRAIILISPILLRGPSVAGQPDTAIAGALLRQSLDSAKTNLPLAKGLAFRALDLYRQAGDVSGTGRSLNAIAANYILAADHDSARILLAEAIRINRRHYPRGLIASYYHLGCSYAASGAFEEARTALQHSISYALFFHNEKWFTDAIVKLGIVSIQQNRAEEAIGLFYTAKTLKWHLGEIGSVANCHINLGNIYSQKGDAANALKYCLQALKLRERIPTSPQEFAAIYCNLGIVYNGVGRKKEAIACFNKSKQLLRSIGLDFELARIDINLSDPYRDLGFYDSARKCLSDAFAVYRQGTINPEGTAHIYIKQARIGNELGQYREAIAAGLKGLELSEKTGLVHHSSEASNQLYIAYKHSGNPRLALHYLEKHRQYLDTLNNATVLQRLEAAKYNKLIADRDSRIQRLKHENELKQQENRVQHLYLMGAIAVSVITGLYFLFYYKQSRIKGMLNRQLRAQKQEIERHAERLEEMNRVKNKIISVISHDVKTPIASLHSLIELNSRNKINADNLPGFMDCLSKSVYSVSLLLENLLGWAGAQLKKVSSIKEWVLVRDMVDEINALYDPMLRGKELGLVNAVPPGFSLHTNKDSLYLVLRNLVSNSIKFSKPGGIIRIGVQNCADNVLLYVADIGTGMDAEAVDRFNKKQTLRPTPGTAKESGHGLGLMLVQESVQLMGGSIEAHSQPGAGTRFTISLPAKTAMQGSQVFAEV